jgi:NAD(P)-dependent dehydrogenase (short-subunit alcohol dehydrogenase family)
VPTALVTGSSTGIGRATALRLDAGGWRVFAGVRREADAESLRGEASERLAPVSVDVTDPAQIEAAARLIGAELDGAGLDGLVNNAGAVVPGPLEMVPLDDFRRQLEVNLTGQLAVTKSVLPLLREARGRIVFISSIGGRIAFPINGPYNITKFGIEAMGDVFRQELRPWGISVSIVEPGSIATQIWERGVAAGEDLLERVPETEGLYGDLVEAAQRVSHKLGGKGIPADRVASVIEHALTSRRPRTRYLVGADAKVQARLKAVTPARAWDRLVARVMGG